MVKRDDTPQPLPGVSVSSYKLSNGIEMWQRVVSLPKGKDGKRPQLKQRGFVDRYSAIVDGNELARRYAKPSAASAASGTIRSELERWLTIKATTTPPHTIEVYRYRLETYVYPHIGDATVHQMTRPDSMAAFYMLLRTRGAKRGGGLAESTVLNIHYNLMDAFTTLGIDVRDVSVPMEKRSAAKRKAELFIAQSDDNHRVWWTQAEAGQFLDYVKNDRLFFIWCLVVVCGFRRGEAAGLRRIDFDSSSGLIRLVNQRTTSPANNRVAERLPKYESVRPLPLADGLTLIGRNHLKMLEVEKAEYGSKLRGRWNNRRVIPYTDSGYLAVKVNGEPYHPDSLRQRMKTLAARAGVPVITLRGGRHTSASVASDEGVPVKTMQHIGGWSRPDVLLNVYTHADLPSRAAGLLTLESALLPVEYRG